MDGAPDDKDAPGGGDVGKADDDGVDDDDEKARVETAKATKLDKVSGSGSRSDE